MSSFSRLLIGREEDIFAGSLPVKFSEPVRMFLQQIKVAKDHESTHTTNLGKVTHVQPPEKSKHTFLEEHMRKVNLLNRKRSIFYIL